MSDDDVQVDPAEATKELQRTARAILKLMQEFRRVSSDAAQPVIVLPQISAAKIKAAISAGNDAYEKWTEPQFFAFFGVPIVNAESKQAGIDAAVQWMRANSDRKTWDIR